MTDRESSLPVGVDQLRTAVRVSSDAFDEELLGLAEAAVEDMERAGVPAAYVAQAPALVRTAVLTYVKSRFGLDNDEAQRLDASYRQALCDLLISPSLYAEGE